MTRLEQFVEGLRKRAEMPVGAPAVQANPAQAQAAQQTVPMQPSTSAQPAPVTRQAPAAPAVPPPVVPTGSPLPQKPQVPQAQRPAAKLPFPKAQPATTPNLASLKRAAAADKVPGGKGDDKPDSAFDPRQLRAGIKVEREHTTDKAIAKEISKDHLTEHKDYYSRLATIEPDAREALKKAELLSVIYKAGVAGCGRKRGKLTKRACLSLLANASDKLSALQAVSLMKAASMGRDEVARKSTLGLLAGGAAGALSTVGAPLGALRGMSRDPLYDVALGMLEPEHREAILHATRLRNANFRLEGEALADYTDAVLQLAKKQTQLGPEGSFKRLRAAVKQKGGLKPTAKFLWQATDPKHVVGRALGSAIFGMILGPLLLRDRAKKKERLSKGACLHLIANASDKLPALKAVALLKAAEDAAPQDAGDDVLSGVGRGALKGTAIGAGVGAAGGALGQLGALSKDELLRTMAKLLNSDEQGLILRSIEAAKAGKSLPEAELARLQAGIDIARAKLPPMGSLKRLRAAIGEHGWGPAAKGVAKRTGKGMLGGALAGAAVGGGASWLSRLLSAHKELQEQRPGEA